MLMFPALKRRATVKRRLRGAFMHTLHLIEVASVFHFAFLLLHF
jgi:hypothetical protein